MNPHGNLIYWLAKRMWPKHCRIYWSEKYDLVIMDDYTENPIGPRNICGFDPIKNAEHMDIIINKVLALGFRVVTCEAYGQIKLNAYHCSIAIHESKPMGFVVSESCLMEHMDRNTIRLMHCVSIKEAMEKMK